MPKSGGTHKVRPFGKVGFNSGLACFHCHKTWVHVNISTAHMRLVATYDLDKEPGIIR
jgi:hypothetical protein